MAAQIHFGPGDSTTFGSVDGGGVGASQSCAKSSLSNMQVGDLLIAWLGGQDATVDTTVTPPSGWVHYGAAMGNPSWSSSRNSAFWYYPLTNQAAIDALPATLTWTFATTGARAGFVVARATGIDLSNIEDVAATSFNSGGGSTSMSIDGITTGVTNALLVGGFYRHNSDNTTVPTCTNFMTGFEEYNTTSTATPLIRSTSAVMGYTQIAPSGFTGDITATFDQIATSYGGELVSFRTLDSGNSTPGLAPYIVGSPTTFTSTTATLSFTIAKPVGVQDGDVLILALSAQTPDATSDFASSGWTRISRSFIANSSGVRVVGFYALPVPIAANVTATNFTFTSTDSGLGGRIAAEVFIVRGAELSNLTDGISDYGVNGPSTTTIASYDTTVNNTLVLTAYNAQFVTGVDYTVATGPNAMQEQTFLVTSTAPQSKTVLAMYKRATPTAGATGSMALTWNGAQSQSSGASVALRPLGGVPPNNGLAMRYTSAPSTMATAKLFYTSATNTLATPKEIRPMPAGYSSVTAMLAQSPFYVAHRGGSKNWPEMSLHAYTQSAFWGVGALEVSLARTSDGVWFGLHDASLDRTSLNTGGGSGTMLVASSLTWAQVQAYQIQYPGVTNSASLPKPYMRWEEIIAAYYPSHVLFIDPKYAWQYTSELLDMMDALPGTPTDHLVAKSYGVNGNAANTTGWPHEAGSRGYQTWGYFYQTDSANFATYQGRFTILGMDYNADAPTWSTIMSYGKPVIGHITPNPTAATKALGYGAHGLMVSGVQEVVPRAPNPPQS